MLFDTEYLNPRRESPFNELRFFQRQLGQSDASNLISAKSMAETNIQQPGMLSNPLMFELAGFNINYHGACPEDIAELKEGVFYFLFAGNRVYLQAPLSAIPERNQIPYGLYPEDRCKKQTRDELLIEYEKRDYGVYEYFVGNKLLRIEPMHNFGIRLEWPQGAPKISRPVRIQVMLDCRMA